MNKLIDELKELQTERSKINVEEMWSSLDNIDRDVLISELIKAKILTEALGNVLEDFSRVVLLSCERMKGSGGVFGSLRNPFG